MDVSRVLIVEDDPLVSENLEEIVDRSFASCILLSNSVAEAEAALAHDIDFALLDVDVLDGTTYAFATRLATQSIPFAFVSASDRDKVPAALRSAPFVKKPFTERDIIGVLRAWEKLRPH